MIILFLLVHVLFTYSYAINDEQRQGMASTVDWVKEDGYGSSFSTHPPPRQGKVVPATDKASHEIIERDTSNLNDEEENDNGGGSLLDTALEFYQTSIELWSKGEQEEALNALDTAYSILLRIDADSDPSIIQQKEDLRFMISKRILEIYASRFRAVNGNHRAIPITINEYVEYEIRQFQTVEREFFLRAYKRSGIYRPMIVKALRDAGLPEELSWLPLIESFFNVRALSPARALGLWQFIPSTGYKYGLKRDEWIDERLDPEKSTTAAIAYLQELHSIFGDWTTVLAAYNCGEGNVLRIIREQKINYLDNFWDLYERLPRETARYVPRFLATLLIVNEPEKYGFDLGETDEPFSFETVNIEKQVSLEAIAKELGIQGESLYDLNPELRLKVTPSRPYPLKVPTGLAETLIARLDNIPEWIPTKIARARHYKVSSGSGYAYHRVQRGETLSSIARRYKTSVNAILSINNIKKGNTIKIGQRLKVPLNGWEVYASTSKGKEVKRYRVKKGDTLWMIAQRFNTDIDTLKRLNGLKSSRLEVGQVIVID
ncbi:MAG: hypothetical protein Fur0020_15640 [Thermodesulfovibrionia bacterium]